MGLKTKAQNSLLALLALVLVFAACKKEDHDPPAVALSLPGEGFVVVADSEFTISGRATDDNGLSSITAILYETATELIVQSKTISVTGVLSNFQMTLRAGDRYTREGEYTLRVAAADAGQNMGSAYQQITIQELPLAFRGLIWAGEGTSNSYSIFKQDTAGNVSNGPIGLQDLSSLMVDSRNNQLVASLYSSGTLLSWDIDGLDQVFRVDLPVGSGAETYTGLSMNDNTYFASLKSPDYMRSYHFDGAPKNSYEQVLYPATAVLATSARVYLGVSGLLGTPQKLDAYDLISSGLAASQVLNWEADFIQELNDTEILVSGNDAGLGRILVLDRQSLVRNQTVELTEELIATCTANGRVWVLSSNGVRELFSSNGTLSGFLVNGNYTALGVEPTRNYLFLGGTDMLEVRTGAGSLLESIQGSFGILRFIQPVLNR